MPILAPLLGALARMFGTRLGQWVLTALAFIGVQLVVSEAFDVGMGAIVAQTVGTAGAQVTQWAGFLNFDRYLSIIVSAYSVAMARNVVLRKKP